MIRRIVGEVLTAHGFPRLPSPAAQRQKRYRERKAQAVTTASQSVTQDVTKRNVMRVTKHNGASHVTVETWAAYGTAYRARYQADPVRNSKVNGQLSQLVKRVGADAAPMSAWYLGHNGYRYVQGGHSIGLLLMDAEKLHTEWATGRKITNTAAQQADRTANTADIFGKLIEEVRTNGKIA